MSTVPSIVGALKSAGISMTASGVSTGAEGTMSFSLANSGSRLSATAESVAGADAAGSRSPRRLKFLSLPPVHFSHGHTDITARATRAVNIMVKRRRGLCMAFFQDSEQSGCFGFGLLPFRLGFGLGGDAAADINGPSSVARIELHTAYCHIACYTLV